MTHLARPLLAFLLSGSVVGPSASASTGPPEGPSIKHIRVVDKFLVAGGASTT